MEKITSKLPEADQIILMSAGNVGGAKLFPFFVRPFHTNLNIKYHERFEKLAKESEKNIIYINLFKNKEEDVFRKNPERYFSKDGLHPSSEGYAFWFRLLEEKLTDRP